jgi:hypothetical protein
MRDTISSSQKQTNKLISALEDIVRTEIDGRIAGERKTIHTIDEVLSIIHSLIVIIII